INVRDRHDKPAQDADQADTLARKLREARTAVQLDQTMSKNDILAGYLNVVEFSGNIYGVGAAAHAYFNTTPDKLTVPQSALLAGVPGGPQVPGSTCMDAAPDAGFFCQYAVNYLERAGFTADQIDTGGYTIRTTMDPTVSQTVKDSVDRNVPTTEDGVANAF